MKGPVNKICWILMLALSFVLSAWGGYVYYMNTKEEVPVGRPKVYHTPDKPEKDELAGLPYDSLCDGVDISKFQGKIRWDEMRRSDLCPSFIYVRVMRKGGGYDELYDTYVMEARKRGIPVGSYIFFTMSVSAKEQFEKFTYMVDPLDQDLVPMIDVESMSIADGNEVHLKDSVLLLAQMMELYYGRRPVIYSNQRFYNEYLSPEFASYPLWIANYSREPVLRSGRAMLWQRSERGHVPGIWTHVDIDVFVNGHSLRELRLR